LKSKRLGRCQDNGNRSNQESKFEFLATRKCLEKIAEGQQKIKIVRTNRQSNLRGCCQSIFSLCRHHPMDGVCAPVIPASGGNILLAMLYTLAAGLSTAVGGLLPFLFDVKNKKWLGAGLGFAAGVMIYLSFVEILPKSVSHFACDFGETGAHWRSSVCFFVGELFPWLVHSGLTAPRSSWMAWTI